MPSDSPLIRFGVIADPQYAPLPPNPALNRHFEKSLGKLDEAIGVFNAHDLAFVVTLGDLVDRGYENFDAVLARYERLTHESILLPGNHDFLVAPEQLPEVHRRLSMPAPYHHFSRNGLRFVVIDGSEESLFAAPEGDPRRARAEARLAALEAAGALNAQTWNGGIGEAQFAWLSGVLVDAAAAGEKVVVLGHYPLYPDNAHNLWDWQALVDLFDRSGNVLAYLCGHNHIGNLGHHGSTWYVNFTGMVDTETENTFAIAEIFPDRLEITGFGREESRALPFDI
ncbi:MAG: metallophosphoesterase [Alphaproteobacteria bacterium]|jgi:3',5'-cyclic AMP phosphodiesterase CpdA|nr:metallophosphoesterase [Alphaproteobacteria bacterium]MBU1551178.1 metallophosphoesterase [Alphaproteobacteria bacterium]MBU2334953.1 metallophosphoesterase [Alphaproteobacteria bacterium]MBU2388857.1 metallophosphoesterase [Alphaproteobacteria bacterium]